jgi:hypothetical protein
LMTSPSKFASENWTSAMVLSPFASNSADKRTMK